MRRSGIWLVALALDVLAGEPPAAVHPVVLSGRLIGVLERRAPTHPWAAMARGVVLVAVPAVIAAGVGRFVERLRPAPVRILASAWLLKSTFALRGLVGAGRRVEEALERGDEAGARSELAALVSRPVEMLDTAHIASAIAESLAENACDSYVAPLCWYALGGLPAALAYRVVNTADAMVGYRGRYEYLGKPAARLDDLVNLVPARLTGIAVTMAAGPAGGSVSGALRALRRDRGRTASPNAGWPMAAAAGALGVWLEKPGVYRLGDGRAPTFADGARARRLVLVAAGLVTAAFFVLDRHGRHDG